MNGPGYVPGPFMLFQPGLRKPCRFRPKAPSLTGNLERFAQQTSFVRAQRDLTAGEWPRGVPVPRKWDVRRLAFRLLGKAAFGRPLNEDRHKVPDRAVIK